MIRLKKYLFIGLLSLTYACQTSSNYDQDGAQTIESDLETVLTDDGKPVFSTSQEGLYIKNANYASTAYAFSGQHSIQLDSTQVYGMNLRLEDLKEGEFIQASVWQKQGEPNGTLVASIHGVDYNYKYRTYYDKNAEGEKGWVRHHISFIVTKGVESIDFFVFSGKHIAYFDDLTIKRYPNAPKNDLPKTLSLYVPKKSKQKIDGFISNALRSDIIPSTDKKYVKSYILDGNDSIKIKMKLKGDWTDHIKSGKTSYRIKIGGNHAFYGRKTFSIQHPKTRNYIHEWILHEMADIEGVLSTKYDFISVKINGFSYGVYAMEEHFDKQLLESRNRREGPILKFDEGGVWALNYASRKQGVKSGNFPYFDASVISMFKQNRTLKSPVLRQQFDEGKNLLNLFKNGHLKVEDIFDIDLLAKFYVLMELSSNNHGLAWHNRRFYYNPVNQKLEHIVYDVIPNGVRGTFKSNVKANLVGGATAKELSFDNALLLSEKFKEKYLYYLELKTRPEYLDSVFALIDHDLEENLKAIKTEEPYYLFDKNEYYGNAEFLRAGLAELDSIWTAKLLEINSVDHWVKSDEYAIRKDTFFVPEISLNAYLTEVDSQDFRLGIENYHLNEISIIGYYVKGSDVMERLDENIKLAAFNGQADQTVISLTSRPKKIVFTVENWPGQVISKKVIPWHKPHEQTSRMDLENGFKPQSKYYDCKDGKVIFSGKLTIDALVYIPDDYTVEVKPGAQIEFKNGGGLVVSNSFSAIGTDENHIQFYCNDASSQGLTVLNGQEAVLKYVDFTGLSNLNYKKWILTGAVTIYETPTVIEHVTIKSNHSEDALNIIRSHFEIENLAVSDTYSDGFDADFCTGFIKSSSFLNTGNDCIDFSGSVVDITDIDIQNSGDKGVSGGERSTLTLSNINIEGAITGIASKDDTKIDGDQIKIKSVEVGYAAFQKKGEYAPAKIVLTNCELSLANQEVLVELHSTIQLNGKVHEGTKKLDIDALYARFAKK